MFGANGLVAAPFPAQMPALPQQQPVQANGHQQNANFHNGGAVFGGGDHLAQQPLPPAPALGHQPIGINNPNNNNRAPVIDLTAPGGVNGVVPHARAPAPALEPQHAQNNNFLNDANHYYPLPGTAPAPQQQQQRQQVVVNNFINGGGQNNNNQPPPLPMPAAPANNNAGGPPDPETFMREWNQLYRSFQDASITSIRLRTQVADLEDRLDRMHHLYFHGGQGAQQQVVDVHWGEEEEEEEEVVMVNQPAAKRQRRN
ncbi:hypothetical protein F5Y17DRAFT_440914 [Xylariaceae sp. FL0594]|nr:hypothetical protein F5Y17DRAFT_440914 [Xylariaceae sp. FL0594]